MKQIYYWCITDEGDTLLDLNQYRDLLPEDAEEDDEMLKFPLMFEERVAAEDALRQLYILFFDDLRSNRTQFNTDKFECFHRCPVTIEELQWMFDRAESEDDKLRVIFILLNSEWTEVEELWNLRVEKFHINLVI